MTLKRKSILFVIALLLLIAAAGFTASKYAPDLVLDIADKAKDSVTGFLTGSETPDKTKFEISADLELKPLELTKASSITLDFSKTDRQISVNSEKLDLSQLDKCQLELQNFDGSIKIGSSAALSGKSSVLSVNKVRVLPNEKSLDVNFDLQYDLVNLILQLDKFAYTSSGKIDVNSGKIVVQLADEELELQNFAGSFAISQGKLQIKGTADNVKVAGKELTANIQ